jgi:hypothetical protein
VSVVGVDLSRPMLEQARHPLLGTRARVALVESSLHVVAFQPGSLHAVYGMGVFGTSWPLDSHINVNYRHLVEAIRRVLLRYRHPRLQVVVRYWRSRLAAAIAPHLRGAPHAYVEAKLRRVKRGRGEVVDTLCDCFEEVRVRRFMGAGGQREDLLCVALAARVRA